MTTVTLDLTPELAQTLWVSSTECFFNEQPDRFEHVEITQVPFGDQFEKGTMLWSRTAADALLLLAYERNSGFNAVLLWDLAESDDSSSYVVMSSREWAHAEASA